MFHLYHKATKTLVTSRILHYNKLDFMYVKYKCVFICLRVSSYHPTMNCIVCHPCNYWSGGLVQRAPLLCLALQWKISFLSSPWPSHESSFVIHHESPCAAVRSLLFMARHNLVWAQHMLATKLNKNINICTAQVTARNIWIHVQLYLHSKHSYMQINTYKTQICCVHICLFCHTCLVSLM